MKTLHLLLLAIFCGYNIVTAQEGTGPYHDPSLDTIANNVVLLDSDINGNFLNGLKTDGIHVSDAMSMSNAVATAAVPGALSTTNTAITKGVGFGSGIAGAYLTASNAMSTAGVSPSSGTNGYTAGSLISLGSFWSGLQQYSYQMNLSFPTGNYLSMPFAQAIRGVILGVFMSCLFLWMLQAIREEVIGTMAQRQAVGSSQEILGFNASLLVAPIFAAVITAALASLVPIIMSSGSVTAQFNAVHATQTWFGSANTYIAAYDVITSYCPIGEIFLAWCNYLIFRYVYMFPLFSVVRVTILWLAS